MLVDVDGRIRKCLPLSSCCSCLDVKPELLNWLKWHEYFIFLLLFVYLNLNGIPFMPCEPARAATHRARLNSMICMQLVTWAWEVCDILSEPFNRRRNLSLWNLENCQLTFGLFLFINFFRHILRFSSLQPVEWLQYRDSNHDFIRLFKFFEYNITGTFTFQSEMD